MTMKKALRTKTDLAAEETVPSEEALCRRLRAARKLRGLSLTELGRRIGCSVGYLSQIERGLSSPSLRTMVALDGPAPSSDGRRIVVRQSERSRLDLPATGIHKEGLTDKNGEGLLNSYEMVIAPGGRSGDEVMSHTGEECGLVLAGRIVLEVGGDVWELAPGDSFRFSSLMPHRYWNPAEEDDARVIWTTTSGRQKT
jgi:quercetin dioxygenase-like cupin family protein/DNA-binding XRE family transcriptional regulator